MKGSGGLNKLQASGVLAAVLALCACQAVPLAPPTPSNASDLPTSGPTAQATASPKAADTARPSDPPIEPDETPRFGPTFTPTESPTVDVVAFTNPDGPAPGDESDGPLIVKARSLPTFAGLWRDPNQHDLHIAVTEDIDGAISKLGDLVPRTVTVYFQLGPNTEKEVCALVHRIFNDGDELRDLGILVQSGGCGGITMRADMGISPVTAETLAYMHDRYPGPADYQSAGVIALNQYEPPDVDVSLNAITPDQAALLVTCGQRPFAVSALDSQPIDVSADQPVLEGLRGAFDTYTRVFGDLSQQTWLLAESDEFGATFLSPRADAYLEEVVVASVQGWVPTTLADCTPTPFDISNAGSGTWALDPSYPTLDPTSTEIHVLVNEGACSGASSPAGRILPPVTDYSDQAVALTVAVRPLGGIQGCPGNPSLPVTIVLPEPLGDRPLVGGN